MIPSFRMPGEERIDSALIFLKRTGEKYGINPRRVLDAGSGPGFFTRILYVLYPAADVYAMDLSKDYLDLGVEDCSLKSSKTVHADIKYPWAGERFDLVIGMNVTADDPSAAEGWSALPPSEFLKFLTPGGFFFYTTPEFDPIDHRPSDNEVIQELIKRRMNLTPPELKPLEHKVIGDVDRSIEKEADFATLYRYEPLKQPV
ncbi:MAG: methyltransferase domain-containing protein [Candidatus Aenigmarchaeota archaeon]|nr:methyltransferase domain-containing protein [Candidatus Aenigmarchaeota archaeon]